MIHTGDQIYADSISKKLTKPNGENKTYDELLEEFRMIYRCVVCYSTPTFFRPFTFTQTNQPTNISSRSTFGTEVMQKVLRHGPNWMIPDDHDIVNNFGPDLHVSPLLAEAGKRAYYEYQYQLFADIPENDSLVEGIPRLDFVKHVTPSTVFVFLDLRMQRTFKYDPVVRRLCCLVFFFLCVCVYAVVVVSLNFDICDQHPMVTTEQLAAFEVRIKTLGEDARVQHIFVITGVPLAVLSKTMSRTAYFVEKEKYPLHPHFANDTLQLLYIMKPYANKIKLISGDLHQVMCV